MSEGATSTRGVTWLPGGSSSGIRTRIGVYHSQPINPRPNLQTQGECSMEDRSEARGLRYIALDIHKQYCVVAGVDREGRLLLQPVRVEHADLEEWLKKHLYSTDHVVIESTTNAWHVYDLLAPLAKRVVVANPIQVKQIANARVKTDIRDTLILARLLAANLVPGGVGATCARS